jgi:phosphohistidine phosphatase
MTLYLLHHADAVSPAVDTRRPLSTLGLAQVAWIAEQARARSVKPDVIWHSGKLRARQTAEAVLRACNPMAEFGMVRGLRPDDPVEWIIDALRGETRTVLLASHMPFLPALAAALAPDVSTFPLNGLMALERGEGESLWREAWRISPP